MLGAGGVARAVAHALHRDGALVTITNRTPERGQKLAEEVGCRNIDWAARHSVICDMLVNCTSVGMHPNVDETPVHPSFLKPGLMVFDTVYTPETTLLVKEARDRGCHVVTGVELFVRQAALQFQLFTGRAPPLELMRKVAQAGAVAGDASGRTRRRKSDEWRVASGEWREETGARDAILESDAFGDHSPLATRHSPLFLIGSRGSGKTTVARLLAERLGWEWVDADDVLEARHGTIDPHGLRGGGRGGLPRQGGGRAGGVVRPAALRRRHRRRRRGPRGQPRAAAGAGRVVWLTADAETLWRRTLDDDRTTRERRPALTVGGRAEVEEVLRAARAVVSESSPTSTRATPNGRTGRSARRRRNLPSGPEPRATECSTSGSGFVFVIGAIVGSFLNVCVARLPFEKSILWPGSRCGRCFQPIRCYDNIPLLGYWLLRGRCRTCGQPFSVTLLPRRAVHRLRLRRPLLPRSRPQRPRPALPARAAASSTSSGA